MQLEKITVVFKGLAKSPLYYRSHHVLEWLNLQILYRVASTQFVGKFDRWTDADGWRGQDDHFSLEIEYYTKIKVYEMEFVGLDNSFVQYRPTGILTDLSVGIFSREIRLTAQLVGVWSRTANFGNFLRNFFVGLEKKFNFLSDSAVIFFTEIRPFSEVLL